MELQIFEIVVTKMPSSGLSATFSHARKAEHGRRQNLSRLSPTPLPQFRRSEFRVTLTLKLCYLKCDYCTKKGPVSQRDTRP
jgi:hypothetical protein